MYWIIFLTRNHLPDHTRSVFADQVLQTLDKVLHLSSQVDQAKCKNLTEFLQLIAGMIMQVLRTLIGCSINTTSHIEGYHITLKVG